jgi:hypothetical protein
MNPRQIRCESFSWMVTFIHYTNIWISNSTWSTRETRPLLRLLRYRLARGLTILFSPMAAAAAFPKQITLFFCTRRGQQTLAAARERRVDAILLCDGSRSFGNSCLHTARAPPNL